MNGPRCVKVLTESSLSSQRAHLDSCGEREMWGKVEDGKHFPVTVMECHLQPLQQVDESGPHGSGLSHLEIVSHSRSWELGSAEGICCPGPEGAIQFSENI